MVNLELMFKKMHEGICDFDPRYSVIDSEHILDNELGVEYHLYGEWQNKPFKISMSGEEVLNGMQMTRNEAGILNSVREYLRKHFAESNRKMLYDLFSGSPKDNLEEVSGVKVNTKNGGYK